MKSNETYCISRNQFTWYVCVCWFLKKRSSTSYINRITNKINGWNGIFAAVVAENVHKNLWIPFLMIRSIQSKYHKILAQKLRHEKNIFHMRIHLCGCANWYIKTNGNHYGFFLGCWIFAVVTHLRAISITKAAKWRSYWSLQTKNAPLNSNSVAFSWYQCNSLSVECDTRSQISRDS